MEYLVSTTSVQRKIQRSSQKSLTIPVPRQVGHNLGCTLGGWPSPSKVEETEEYRISIFAAVVYSKHNI